MEFLYKGNNTTALETNTCTYRRKHFLKVLTIIDKNFGNVFFYHLYLYGTYAFVVKIHCWFRYFHYAGANPCAGNPCASRPYSICSVVGGQAVCRCNSVCAQEINPVCGSDGKTYDSVCRLRYAACSIRARITVVARGRCGDPGRTEIYGRILQD